MSFLNKTAGKVQHFFTGIVLIVVVIAVVASGIIIEDDLHFVPISDISTIDVEAEVGGIARIPFTYTRLRAPRKLEIVSRTLSCDDGTLWHVTSPFETNTVWPLGEQQSASISINIPANVAPNQACYYSSPVLYYRTILSPILMKIPPDAARIFVNEPEKD